MAQAGTILAATLDLIEAASGPASAPPSSTRSPSASSARGAPTPTFKGYRGFPGSICASPNAMIVHGIPGPYRLAAGDIISIDVGVTLGGWVADAARTFAVGEIDEQASRTCCARPRQRCTRASAQCVAGQRMGDVSSAIQRVAEDAGLAVVRSLVGHGVGRSMHEDPQVPNYGKPGQGPAARAGHGARDRADDDRGRPAVRVGARRLGDLLPGRLAGGALRVHRRDHRGGPADLTPWHLPAGAARRRSPMAEGIARRG